MKKIKEAVTKTIKFIWPIRVETFVFSLLIVLGIYPIAKKIEMLDICILFLIVEFISAQKLRYNLSLLKNLRPKRGQIIAIIFLAVWFICSIFGAFGLEDYYADFYKSFSIFYYPTVIISSMPLFIQLLCLMMQPWNIQINSFDIKWKILSFLLLIIHYALWIYAFNPAITTSDSADIFYHAKHLGEIEVINWHPPFYTIIMHYLLTICDSETFLIAIQCIAFSLVFVTTLFYLIDKGLSIKIALVIYLFLGFTYSNTLYMITLWKDIPYAISLYWLTYLIIKFLLEKHVNICWYIQFIIAMVFSSLFRQNGIVVGIGIAIVLIVHSVMKKNIVLALCCVASVAVIAVISGPVYNYYNVVPQPGLKYFALANDVVGTFYNGGQLSETAMEIVDEVTEGNWDEYKYDAYYTNYNRGAFLNYKFNKFISSYLETFVNNPKIMFRQIIKRNSMLWSVIRPYGEHTVSVNVLSNYRGEGQYLNVFSGRRENKLISIYTYIDSNVINIGSLYIFTWRVGIFVVLILFLLYRQLFYTKSNGKILVFLPCLLNLLSLVVGSGWATYRYFWPTTLLSLLICMYVYICPVEKI